MDGVAYFNPHARVGRDPLLFYIIIKFVDFNPHARVGRDRRLLRQKTQKTDFNPHARVGRDFGIVRIYTYEFFISIRTPAWGVTL